MKNVCCRSADPLSSTWVSQRDGYLSELSASAHLPHLLPEQISSHPRANPNLAERGSEFAKLRVPVSK